VESILKRSSTRTVFLLLILFIFSILIAVFTLRLKRSTEIGLLHKPLANPRIVINKDRRLLYLYSDSKLVCSYKIALGSQPVGDKLTEGDDRTPEGRYYICAKNPNSRYYLSLAISYPNIRDAERGLHNGLIAREQYEAIVQAIKVGATPPWDTPLGGEVFIHGHGSGSDWTKGCIALDDKDIRQLYDAVDVGTPVDTGQKTHLFIR